MKLDVGTLVGVIIAALVICVTAYLLFPAPGHNQNGLAGGRQTQTSPSSSRPPDVRLRSSEAECADNQETTATANPVGEETTTPSDGGKQSTTPKRGTEIATPRDYGEVELLGSSGGSKTQGKDSVASSGGKPAPVTSPQGTHPRELAMTYLPIAQEQMKRAGVQLSAPLSTLWPVRAVQQKGEGIDAVQINVFCRQWDVVLDADTYQVRYYANSAISESQYRKYAELSAAQSDSFASLPQLDEQKARGIVAARGFLKAFGVDQSPVDLGYPVVHFRAEPEQRGWHFRFARRSGGYPFFDEDVSLVIDDEVGELLYYRNNTSNHEAPHLDAQISDSEILRHLLAYVNGEAHFMSHRREEGFIFEPQSAKVQTPHWVHANSAFESDDAPMHSFDYPVKLAFICQCQIARADGSSCELMIWIDAITGAAIGGDYRYTFTE